MKLLIVFIFIINICCGQAGQEKVFTRCYSDCGLVERIFLNSDGSISSQTMSGGTTGVKSKIGTWQSRGDTMKFIPKKKAGITRKYFREEYSNFIFLVSENDHSSWDTLKARLDYFIKHDSTYNYFSEASESSITMIKVKRDIFKSVFYSGDHPANIYISDLLYELNQSRN